MPRSPAVIIIARHGARLDAADKTWHLTSPTPYDPPLTYGGWSQSRALGTRIASILDARQEADEEYGGHSRSHSLDGNIAEPRPSGKKKPRKYKVVVHSSPFIRCVQTSVAICSGIAQFQGKGSSNAPSPNLSRSNSPHRRRATLATANGGNPPDPKIIPEAEDNPTRNVLGKALLKKEIEKTTLRIDAFLGEWLSPDYYESITPPPPSTMMVASAKAELLRRSDYVDSRPNSRSGNFPGGWGSDAANHGRGGSLSALGSLAQALPLRDRAGSQDSASSHSTRKRAAPIPAPSKSDMSTYRAPIPSYAISPAEPIPRGYVAHARDACVDIDYQWDSMREPHEWGDGGQLPEEWSSMHKRFRRGLTKMVEWYQTHNAAEHPEDAVVETHDDLEEDDEELVLVLVTHGAGCNALIGALTNQPVLLDVGMASLTMAVRKDAPEQEDPMSPTNSTFPSLGRQTSGGQSRLSDEYDMVLVASAEHLRMGADPARLGPMPAPQAMAQFGDRRYSVNAVAGDGVGEPARKTSSSLGSMRRSSTIHNLTRSYTPSPGRSTPESPTFTPSIGLWSKRMKQDDSASTGTNTPNTDFSLSEQDRKTNENKIKENDQIKEQDEIKEQESNEMAEAVDDVKELPPKIGRSMSQHGLWGSLPTGSRNERVPGPKRRWTIDQREA
ncbi:uncharacterized protein J3D65DRAFT_568903 [Phyllosticta citribraziliensis]|uniref:Phosphoglycerate mutase family protein n=1 Tax=Phyllosticta citribraziliensis TaxID=989973 RepID=A0ABR1M0G8_9PEZI